MLDIGIKHFILLLFILQTRAYDEGYYLQNEVIVERIFDYFRAENPKGIPVFQIEEPFAVPFEVISPGVIVTNASIYGLSDLVIDGGYIDMKNLKSQLSISIPLPTVVGDYEYEAFITTNSGEWNATMSDLHVMLNVTFIIEYGLFQIKDVTQYITMDELFLDVTNLTWLHLVVHDSGALNMFFHLFAELAFNQNKEILLNEVNYFLQEFSNTLPQLVSLPHNNKYYDQILQLPENRRNLVLFVARVLHYSDFDPVRPPSKTIPIIGINVKLTDIEVSGLSEVTDIKALVMAYQNKKVYITISMVFPHILVRYNATFSRFYLTVKSKPRNINIYNLEANVTMTIDLGQVKSIQKIDFNGKAEWIGNLGRYNSESSFRKFFNKIEKFMQTHFLKIFIKIVQPVIESRLKEINLEKSILSFLRKM